MPGANFAHDARWAGVGNRAMSRPISAMMIAAAIGPIPGLSSRATAPAKEASWTGERRRGTDTGEPTLW